MKKVCDMTKEAARILCVAVFFPGIEINFEAIQHYFAIRETKEAFRNFIAYCKRSLSGIPQAWLDRTQPMQRS